MEPIYKRVLLKISGEALAGSDHFGINEAMTQKVAKEVKQIHDLGVEVAIVVGGGNFWIWTARPPTTWECWQQS